MSYLYSMVQGIFKYDAVDSTNISKLYTLNGYVTLTYFLV